MTIVIGQYLCYAKKKWTLTLHHANCRLWKESVDPEPEHATDPFRGRFKQSTRRSLTIGCESCLLSKRG
jgi:hypothetical protein